MDKDAVSPRTPRRYLLWAAIAFGLGIAAERLLSLSPSAILIAAAAAAPLTAFAFFARLPRALATGALVLAALAGALDYRVRAAGPDADEVGALAGASTGPAVLTEVTGRVEEVLPPSSPGGSYRIVLAVESVGEGAAARPAGGRLRLSRRGGDPGSCSLRAGMRVALPAMLSAPEGPRSPGSMDYPEYLAARGVWTTGRFEDGTSRELSSGGWSIANFLNRSRERAAEVIRRNLPAREGALLNTLLINWRNEMDPEDQMAFTRTGTAHLLSVGGVHLMLLVGTLWWFLRAARLPSRILAAVLIAFVVAYAGIAGAQAPVLRSALAAALVLGGMSLGKQADGMTSLAAGFLIILAAWPRDLFTISFQMSFAAVAFLIAMVPALDRAWTARRGIGPETLAVEKPEVWRTKAWRWVRLSIFTSLAATAATMPLQVRCFGILTPWGVLVNLAAIPVCSLVLALGMIMLVVGLICPPAAFIPAAAAWGALKLLEFIVGAGERLPGCSPMVEQPPVWMVLAFYAVAAALLLPGIVPERWRARSALAVMLLSVAVSLAGGLFAKAPGAPRVTVFAARYGRSAVYEDPAGRSCAVWAGSGREVADYLRDERLGVLDCALVPNDAPEAYGGLAGLERAQRAGIFAVPGGNLLGPEGTKFLQLHPEAERLTPGWRRKVGAGELEAFGAAPYTPKSGGERARPILVLAGTGGDRVLFADFSRFAGQSVRAASAEMSARKLRAEVLAVGFDWRTCWGSTDLVKLSGARVALVSLSPYEAKEPAGRELVATLRGAGLQVLSTAELGSLRATILPDRIRVESWTAGEWRPLVALRRQRSDAETR